MTQTECEELHRDLINWNPRARLCELDTYSNYTYYNERGQAPAALLQSPCAPTNPLTLTPAHVLCL